jgi:hypothetical protein
MSIKSHFLSQYANSAWIPYTVRQVNVFYLSTVITVSSSV